MHRRCLLVLCLVSIACGQTPKDSARLENVPGEDSTLAVLMGQGLNHLDWTPKGHCVELGELKTQTVNGTGQFAEYRLQEITSITHLRESLNISAAASVKSALFGKYSAQMEYAKSINKNSSSRYLLVHTRVGNQMKLAKSFTYTPKAQALLRAGKDKEFVEQCGTQFVYGIRTGGEFFALFEYEFSSSEEEKLFSSAVKASGTGWKVSTKINEEMQRFNMSARVHVTMRRMGGRGDLPKVENFEQFARKFPTAVSSVADSVALELITKDYSGVEPIDLTPNPQLLVRQEVVMTQLAKNRDHAQEVLNTIRHVQLHPKAYRYDPNEHHLDKWETDVVAYINDQNNAAVGCFQDLFEGCKLPDTSFPGVVLPDLISSNACRFVMERVCKIPSANGACMGWEDRRVKKCV